MSQMNKAILIGNLTRDPETRTTQSGIACTTFTLAINRRYTDDQGRRQADFIPVVTWRQTAEACARYLAQGRKCAVVGTIQPRSYDAQDGTKRYVTEVVADEVEFLGGQQLSKTPPSSPPPKPQQERMNFYQEQSNDYDDDELPF